MAAAEKDDWLDDFDSPEDKAPELDQSNIDDLLSDSPGQGQPAAEPPVPSKEEELELAQSAIDALMSDPGDLATPAPQSAAAEESELDQSDVDALLTSPQTPGSDQAALDPDQDEIDKLFSDVDSGSAEEASFPAEEIDFKDVFNSTDDSAPRQNVNLDFDAEEFKLDADIPDIPSTKEGVDHEAPSMQEDTVVASPSHAGSTAQVVEVEEPGSRSEGSDSPVKVPGLLHNRKLLVGVGVCLLGLICAAGFLFLKSGSKTVQNDQSTAKVAEVTPPPPEAKPHEPAIPHAEAPPPPEPMQPEPEPEPAKPQNAAPTVADLDLTMPPESKQLTITLSGTDPENDPLQYVLSLPAYGQISGHPPNLIYTPDPDFSGPDGFYVRATDGKHISAPAIIKITRQPPAITNGTPSPVAVDGTTPDNAPPAGIAKAGTPGENTPKPEEPTKSKPEVIQAKNKSYTLKGAKGQLINWQKIWSEVNFAHYNKEVRIDILAAPKHGSLKKINNRQSLYIPNQAFKGMETIPYRFKLGKLASAGKTITIGVYRKNSAPAIHLQPLAPSYMVADTVILNAIQTSDENRETLNFKWQQLSGAPVSIKPLNSEGSQIAFVVPAIFNTDTNPYVMLQVTATDQEGVSSSKDISFAIKSRRTSAIWR